LGYALPKISSRWCAVLSPLLVLGCATSFQSDVNFLQCHTETLVLVERNGPARVAVCPELQGRVMTSSAAGLGGQSYGWINYSLIESGKIQTHINVYGGEDRLWLGPEGGPFSLFFAKGATQDLEHWFTPAPIDSEGFIVSQRSDDHVTLRKAFQVTNTAGTVMDIDITREIKLLGAEYGWKHLGLAPDPEDLVHMVAYESINRLTNVGKIEWTRKTGMPSIWILGMFTPSSTTTIVVPFRKGLDSQFGPIVNDTYFGKVPPDRLKIGDGALYFRGDGQYRSKIGISPRRARPILGSWDSGSGVLTLVQYTFQDDNLPYVNSMWGEQKDPLSGDTVNSYNDGPVAPGQPPLGPFYELESSSPAAALRPGVTLRHVHRTFHLIGPRAKLDAMSKSELGVGLDEIEAAFGK
jgi:hypothetical protein